ncbi:MAG TPA: hypothetical protein PKD12_23795 [Nitrospira sp.]|nr:hypothetical protein [Nitrospira sp.]
MSDEKVPGVLYLAYWKKVQPLVICVHAIIELIESKSQAGLRDWSCGVFGEMDIGRITEILY